MSEMIQPDAIFALVGVAVEGAVDRFCGRPADQNPYSPTAAEDEHHFWRFGWEEGDFLLALRGQREARRWLGEARA